MLAYLAQARPNIGSTLYPPTSQQEIDMHMMWYQAIFAPCTQRIVKLAIGAKAFGDRAPSAEEKQRVQSEMWDIILQKIEQTLVEKERKFICSDDQITVVDIQYYNEIQQVLKLGDVKSVDQSKLPELAKWLARVDGAFVQQSESRGAGSSPALADLSGKFDAII